MRNQTNPVGGNRQKDLVYAERFWNNYNTPKSRAGMEEVMKIDIDAARELGYLQIPMNSTEFREHGREKMSAYRTMARDLGLNVGPFSHYELGYAKASVWN